MDYGDWPMIAQKKAKVVPLGKVFLWLNESNNTLPKKSKILPFY